MTKLSYSGYRFPPEIIQHAIWLYLRFTLSFRDVEDLLAERGIMVSYETVRRWVNHFGPMAAPVFACSIRVRAGEYRVVPSLRSLPRRRIAASPRSKIMRAGGMRPKYLRPACRAIGRDRRLSSVRIPGGGPCRYTCHAGSSNDAHGA